MQHVSLLHVTADLLLALQGLAGHKTSVSENRATGYRSGETLPWNASSLAMRLWSTQANFTEFLHFSLVKKNTAIWRLCSYSNDTWLAHASLAAIACFETDFACSSSSRADCSAVCKSAWLMRSACKSEHWQSKNKESPQGQQWFNYTIHMHHLGAASFAMRSSRYFLDARALGISATRSVQIPN